MLSEFYLTIEDFQADLKACGGRLANWDGVDHLQRRRMADLGEDIVSFAESFVTAHINATMWVLDGVAEVSRHLPLDTTNFEDMQAYLTGEGQLEPEAEAAVKQHFEQGQRSVERMIRRGKSRAKERDEDAAAALKACYKAYLFFIRAFHDAAYGMLLNLSGRTPGAYSSMNDCIKKQALPVFEMVNGIPGYVEWFKAFKKKRDDVKRGVGFSLSGSQWDVGVGFTRATREGGIVVSQSANHLRLGDMIDAVRYSAAIVGLVASLIPDSQD